MHKPIVIDNFHPCINEIREHALSQEFVDWEGFDGVLYRRIAITDVPLLQHIIEELFGPVDMLGMGYRLNYDEELPNQAIHSDLGWGTHALVLYLSDGESGTAFWQHIPTATVRIDEGDKELLQKLNNDWEDPDKWRLNSYVDMKFNRALIYESALYHSRYPFKAFGNSPETGRLIAVAFFSPRIKL